MGISTLLASDGPVCRTFRHLPAQILDAVEPPLGTAGSVSGKLCSISQLEHKAIPPSWTKSACRGELGTTYDQHS